MTTNSVKSYPRRHTLALAMASLLTPATAAVLAAPSLQTLPSGGQVVAGQAVVVQVGNRMTIDQGSDKAILNWSSFNIGKDASVTFRQPGAGAIALNRVMSSDPSALHGQLSANGQVVLINPNGILFGQGARVDVGGLVASTLNLSNQDFLDGRYRFQRQGATGSIVNQGQIDARYVALLAPEVRNEGFISAKAGTVALAGGEAITLNITGQDLVDVQIDKASIDTLVDNRKLIRADDGTVILSAQSAQGLLGKVVNSGKVEANGIVADGGTIRFSASATIENTGSVSANAGDHGKGGTVFAIADLSNPESRTVVDGSWSATGGRLAGDGGFIETSANHLTVRDSARIGTLAPNGKAGQWLLDPNDFTIAAAGGDITGAALTAALAGGDVTITTTAGNATCVGVGGCTVGTAGNGDINVNTGVTIGAGFILTLSAYRNINFNSQIAVNSDGDTRLYLWYGMKGAGQPGAIVVNPGGGTTGAGTNVKGGNFITHGIPSYPVLGNLVYTPPDVDAYVRLAAGSSVYGDNPNPSYGIYDSFSGGSPLNISPQGTVAWTTPLTATTAAGTYSVSYSNGFSLSGYAFKPDPAVTWIITPRPITVTVGKTYDRNATFNSGFVVSNLVNNDVFTLSGQAPSADAGTYNRLSGLSLGNANYSLTSLTATISPKPVTLSASKVYDGTSAFSGGFNLNGVIAGDTVSVTGSASTSSANVGTYSLAPTSLSLSSGNYSLTNLSATITPKTLTVAADNKGRIFGKVNPELTYTVSGYVPGEDATSVGLSGAPVLVTTANLKSWALTTYPITVDISSLSLVSSNYVLGSKPGVFTIRTALGDTWVYVFSNFETVSSATHQADKDNYSGGSSVNDLFGYIGKLLGRMARFSGNSGSEIMGQSKLVLNTEKAMASFVKTSDELRTGKIDLNDAKFGYADYFDQAIKSLCPDCSGYSDAEYEEWFGVTSGTK